VSKYNSEDIREHAMQFSKDNFKKKMKEFIEKEVEKPKV